jgi:hypothetical protein
MVTEADIGLADGRTLHAYDTRADGMASSSGAPDSPVAVFWLYGSPSIGSLPDPLLAGRRRERPALCRQHWVLMASCVHDDEGGGGR